MLIATDIAARGIDVDGISHVINFDFPPQPEDYVHRIGRTGRAQAIGDAISFVTHEDADGLRKLERFLGRGITRKKLDGYVPPSQALVTDRSRLPRRTRARVMTSTRPSIAGPRARGSPKGLALDRSARSALVNVAASRKDVAAAPETLPSYDCNSLSP